MEFTSVICIRNTGYPASLEVLKIYRAIKDGVAEAKGLLRVIDESGEDYLYSDELFVPISLPKPVEAVLAGTNAVRIRKKHR